MPTRELAGEILRRIFGSLNLGKQCTEDENEEGVHTVKCDRNESHAGAHPEYLIHDGIVWLDPTREIEIAQCRKDKVRKPVPAERAGTNNRKEGVSGYFPGIEAVIKSAKKGLKV